VQHEEALQLIYNQRHTKDIADAVALLYYTKTSGLLLNNQTNISWAGVVTGLCRLHAITVPQWKVNPDFAPSIDMAYKIARDPEAQEYVQWIDYNLYRWVITGHTDLAWALLCMAHSPNEPLRKLTIGALSRVLHTPNGLPITDSQGNTKAKAQFDDLRMQMTELAPEFAKMSIEERKRPFTQLPFSAEYLLAHPRSQVLQ